MFDYDVVTTGRCYYNGATMLIQNCFIISKRAYEGGTMLKKYIPTINYDVRIEQKPKV